MKVKNNNSLLSGVVKKSSIFDQSDAKIVKTTAVRPNVNGGDDTK